MRYIGNKTRLLGFIRRVLRARGIGPGRAVDPFSGTASVARALKRWQFGVAASDIMEYGFVLARAYVQVVEPPSFDGVACETGGPSLRDVLRHLNQLQGEHGFISEHYTLAGSVGAAYGRMYFLPGNAARIDAIRHRIHQWHAAGRISDDGAYTLVAALIEAADRVANTAGVYAGFVKTWQPNARRSLGLRVAPHVNGNGCTAARLDAADAVQSAGEFDLLYLDPPYNVRQYAGYYHIPELLARGWFNGPIVMRGKTGLIEDRDRRTAWSSSRKCEAAFEALVANARCREIVMSYNAEGIIPEHTIERVMKTYGRRGTYRRYTHSYRRYSSHSEDEVPGRSAVVNEYLYCVSR